MKPIRKAVLPVAGLGTRFLPATKCMPKEMLPVVDKPLIQYAIEEAYEAGIEAIMLVTGRGKNLMEDHFDHAVELEHTLEARGKLKELDLVRQFPAPSKLMYTPASRRRSVSATPFGVPVNSSAPIRSR